MLYMLIPYRGTKQFSNMHAIAFRTHDRVFLCYCLMLMLLLHPRRRRVILLHSHYLKNRSICRLCLLFVKYLYAMHIYSYAINNGRDTPRSVVVVFEMSG